MRRLFEGAPARLWLSALLGGSLLAGVSAAPAPAPVPLARAHAHNDYAHPRPLLDALEHGFCSVEADIHLVDGRLLVAHDRREVRPERDLQSLYLGPLRERVRKNGGRVHPGGPELSLLIDVKTEAEATYRALRQVLAGYTDLLTTYRGDRKKAGAVAVILSGNRARRLVEAEDERLVAIDGRLEDLGTIAPAHRVPWISAPWYSRFRWTGNGAMPEEERKQLRTLVAAAHAEGRKVRFWATPENPAVWRELLDAGVDLINTDRLAELQRFLLDHPRGGPALPQRTQRA